MMTMTVGPEHRAAILGYASHLLSADDRQNPVAVAAAALPLLEWAEQSADEDDLRCRMRALFRQDSNQRAAGSPGQFVDDAGTLYAFISAGRRS